MLSAGIIGLSATLAAVWIIHLFRPLPFNELAEIWGGGLAVTVIIAAACSRLSPDSLLVTARLLDGRFAAKGRLEAAALLKDSDGPLAMAQREETARYLARETQARAVRALPWLRGILALLILAHLLTLGLWFKNPFAGSTKPLAATAPQPPQQQVQPKASITWQTPESATQANPAAEIPTTATVESTTGLKNLTLEVSVNGQLKKSIPLPDDAANTPGSHDIKVALHLDDMKPQPFDVVSYYLQGQQISDEKQPETTSPVQFVQVRPFRDASRTTPPPASTPGAPPPIDAAEALSQLELAQLQAMQDNFALAHSEVPPTDPARTSETARVGNEQTELAKRTDDIAKALADEHQPSATTDQLHQAEPLMDDSGKKILATQNDAAAETQQQALNLIIQSEKSVYQAESAPSPSAAAPANQTFTDSPPHQLAPREQTLLGQLETLAKNQADLSQDMDKSSGDSTAASSSNGSASPTTLFPVTTPPAATPPATTSPANPAPGTPPPAAASQATTPSVTTPPNANNSSPAANPTPASSPPPIDPFGPDAEKGSPAEREQLVIQGVAALQSKADALPESGHDALASAQKDSSAALQQLSAEQPEAAREPAAAAALDLQQTIRALNQAGEQATMQALTHAQQELNAAASQLHGLAQGHPTDAAPQLMDIATQVHDVQQGLESAADHEQDAGSAQGASQLNVLASKIQDQKIAPNLAAMSKSGLDPGQASAEADALENLAGQAASGTTPAQPSPQDYAGLASSLEQSEATLAHLADKAGGDSTASSPTPDSPANNPGSQPGQQSGQQIAQGTPANTPGSQAGQPSSANSMADPPPAQTGQPAGSNSPAAPNSQPGQQPGQPSAQQTAANQSGEKPTSAAPVDPATSEVYHEALQDLKNQTQQTARLVPNADATAVEQVIIRYDKDTSYRDVKGVDVVRFHTDLQQPLEKLITDVEALQQHAQRGGIVTTPDLDETPPAYRPAVSRYFEDVSRDYHSPPPASNP